MKLSYKNERETEELDIKNILCKQKSHEMTTNEFQNQSPVNARKHLIDMKIFDCTKNNEKEFIFIFNK